MICERCGGLVLWRGPLSDLTHTECQKCGGQNCQVFEHHEVDDEPDDEHDCGEDTCCCAGQS